MSSPKNQFSETNLNAIFWARSVAVVGASATPSKLGHIITKNILEGGYAGNVYPINPSSDSILGLTAYPDLEDIPGDVDLVIFCIPGPLVPGLLGKAAAKNARGAIIISGGFREVGNSQLEQELIQSAQEHHIRLIGPNCQGVNFTPNKLCASWPLFTKNGSLAVISQSGTVAATLAGWAEEEGIGISGVISLGNQSDLCETDFLEVFGQDEQTQVIAMYVEGVKNGPRFMDVVRKIDKPIIVLKSGRTPGGEKAAASHTKSLAGRDDVFSGICQQLGILRATTIEELYDFAKGFTSLPLPGGNRLMIITSSGGSGILAVDVAEEGRLQIPSLNTGLATTLRGSSIPASTVIGNPLDLTGNAASEDYLETLQIAEQADFADMYLMIFGDPIPGSAEKLANVFEKSKKPIGICYLGGGQTQAEELSQFHQRRIPVYPTPERAARVLAAIHDKKNLLSYRQEVYS